MEEKPKSIAVHALLYCLYPAMAMIVFGFFIRPFSTIFQGFSDNLYGKLSSISSISYVFLVFGMVYGTLKYRREYLNGNMSYRKAFTSCFLIGLFCFTIVGAFKFIDSSYINPEIYRQYQENVIKGMTENSALDDQQAETIPQITKSMMAPVVQLIIILIVGTVFSTILSLILACFLKRQGQNISHDDLVT